MLCDRLDYIFRETGFLLLKGHGVPDEIIAAQWKVVDAFFALPVDKKQEVAVSYVGYPYGRVGLKQEALAASRGEEIPPDLKESFNGGPLSIPEGIVDPRAYQFCYQPTPWPNLDEFKIAWITYYWAM